MNRIFLISAISLCSGCAQVNIVEKPPNLLKCSKAGWVESEISNKEKAVTDIKSKAKALGSNVVYLLPINTQKLSGQAYKCNH